MTPQSLLELAGIPVTTALTKRLTESTSGGDADQVEKVISRLQASHPEFTKIPSSLRRDIADKFHSGWTANEIVRYMSYMEEVNPDIDEDQAIRNMKRLRGQVETRLAA